MVAFADVVLVLELFVHSQSVLQDPVEMSCKVLSLDVTGHLLVPGLCIFVQSQPNATDVHVECE